MVEYNVLEIDYSSEAFQKMDTGKLILFATQKTDSLRDLFNTDPLLCKLNENEQAAFLFFVSGLHICAARERAEFSLAIHSTDKVATVVIVSEKLEMRSPLNSIFSVSAVSCHYVYVEPIHENGSKLMFYFRYSLA